MLKLHPENITELKSKSYDFDDIGSKMVRF